MNTTRTTPSRVLPRRMLGIIMLAGLSLLGARPDAAAQYFGSAIGVGGPFGAGARAVARDAGGNAYITGDFGGTVDFDPGPGTTNLTKSGSTHNRNAFVAKYSPTGAFIWARQVASDGVGSGNDIAVDPAGNVFVAGRCGGLTSFGGGNFQAGDIFVCKLDTDGGLAWARTLGGVVYADGIAVDAAGNVLTMGSFSGTVDFDPGAGTFNLTGGGNYVSKLDGGGNFVWAKSMGAGAMADIAVDASGNVLTTGNFSGTVDFDPGAGTANLTSAGLADCFIRKLDGSGNFVWAKAMGGTGDDFPGGIAVDASGNVLTTGIFNGTADFDPGAGTSNLISAGQTDIFISKLDSNGNFVFAKGIGGTDSDLGSGVAVDAAGNVLTTGSFRRTVDFDPGAGTANLTSAGGWDVFVSKLDSHGNFLFAKNMGGPSDDSAIDIAVDSASANVFTIGGYSSGADFDPGVGTTTLVNPGGYFFLSRLTAHSKVLWSATGTPALIWTVDGFGAYVSSVIHGPFSGFTPTSYASHRDGTARLLWTDPASGYSGIWKLDASDAFTSAAIYGPFPGLIAADYSADPEGSGRLLWSHPSGVYALWNVDANGQFVSGAGYGPMPGFTINSFVASPGLHFGSAISAGSATDDLGNAIARDAAGNVYVTGIFFGTVDFDPGAGTVNLTSAGRADIFVAKYNPTGALIWARSMGGIDFDNGLGIAVDASGNVFTTGLFVGTGDFDPGAGTANLTSAGLDDIFVSKLDTNGNFVWAKGMGGTGDDWGLGVAVDASGNVLTTGRFTDTGDFDPGAGTVNLTSAGDTDIFVSKLNSSGNFVFAKGMGGTGSDQGQGIAGDASGNVLTTGYFSGTADFDPGAGATDLVSAGETDIFVSKLDGSGNAVFAKGMGGTGFDYGLGLAVDASGKVFTTGSFQGTGDFDPGAGTANLTSAGSDDIFVSKLDSSGNFVFGKRMGGTGSDTGRGIAVDASGNALTTGHFTGTADFGLGAGAGDLTSAGSDDIFVSKLDSRGDPVFARQMGGTGADRGRGIAADPASANVFTIGTFSDSADFDSGSGTANLASAGGTDMFLSRLTVHSKVLWSQPSGPAHIWTVDGLDAFVSSVTYGPFAGFTATSYASHRDGTARLVWTDPTSGFTGLWKLDANDAAVSSTAYVSFPGLMATTYTADPDGSGRLLWSAPNGAQTLWNVDANGQFVSRAGYGPVLGFKINSFVASP